MIEIHTKLTCSCGNSFHAMYVNTAVLSKGIHEKVLCPFCGNEVEYAYEFSADFPCNHWYSRATHHYICNHMSFNEGAMTEEVYPRNCKCGKEILLKQRRVI